MQRLIVASRSKTLAVAWGRQCLRACRENSIGESKPSTVAPREWTHRRAGRGGASGPGVGRRLRLFEIRQPSLRASFVSAMTLWLDVLRVPVTAIAPEIVWPSLLWQLFLSLPSLLRRVLALVSPSPDQTFRVRKSALPLLCRHPFERV